MKWYHGNIKSFYGTQQQQPDNDGNKYGEKKACLLCLVQWLQILIKSWNMSSIYLKLAKFTLDRSLMSQDNGGIRRPTIKRARWPQQCKRVHRSCWLKPKWILARRSLSLVAWGCICHSCSCMMHDISIIVYLYLQVNLESYAAIFFQAFSKSQICQKSATIFRSVKIS